MIRHFLGLYALIVLTLAAVSCGQDKILQAYGARDALEDGSLRAATWVLAHQLQTIPQENRKAFLARTSADTGLDAELFDILDLTGAQTLNRLRHGEVAAMSAGAESWVLKQLDGQQVLALRFHDPGPQRGPLEWALTLVFYAAIALVIMVWIWPLARDVRALDRAAAQFGNRKWRFADNIKPHSQIYGLARTFRKMAERIEMLIASHKDMSNAVSHDIRTPLARMKFEIELARQSDEMTDVRKGLDNVKSDIAEIDALVTATLDYAILERADLSLNIGLYDFTTLIPAITDAVRADTPRDIQFITDVRRDATRVNCDLHQFETILKNLLHNAGRYARREIVVAFGTYDDHHHLSVDDDGPGIPEDDRERAFESFVQLDKTPGKRTGFGLGLAIVKRAVEWHGGKVVVSDSPLGGARFAMTWPAVLPARFDGAAGSIGIER